MKFFLHRVYIISNDQKLWGKAASLVVDRFFGDIPEAASVGPPPGLADASGNPAHQGNVDPKDSFCDVPQARLWMQRVS